MPDQAVTEPEVAVAPTPVEPPAVPGYPAPALATSATRTITRPASLEQDVVYVPLAITVGDGFKFGCGFFMAGVITMLVGVVLVAALFALTTLFGVNLPINR